MLRIRYHAPPRACVRTTETSNNPCLLVRTAMDLLQKNTAKRNYQPEFCIVIIHIFLKLVVRKFFVLSSINRNHESMDVLSQKFDVENCITFLLQKLNSKL